jgi:putative flavoprotein involved in K+ transport
VVETLSRYADDISAPVRTGTVTAMRRNAGAFVLDVDGEDVRARSVVVATGAFQRPRKTAEDAPRDVLTIHSSAYRRPQDLPEGGVLVVGSGQSGCEIGLELLESGRDVHLAVGRCGWFPRRYRGRELMRWFLDVGLLDETPDMLPAPEARLGANVAVSGSRGGRDCNALVLERAGARLYGRFDHFEAGRVVFAPSLDDGLQFGRDFERTVARRCDEWAATSGLDLPPAEPVPARPRLAHDPTELVLENEGVTSIVWAGGYRPDFGWIDLPVFDQLGFPRADRGVTEAPGLAFVGLPWLHRRKSPLLLGVGEDAAHVARAMAAHVATR